jgi:hypothetical protein
MNGDLYLEWREGKIKYLKSIFYTDAQIEYIIGFFNGIEGKGERLLVEEMCLPVEYVQIRNILFDTFSKADPTNWLNFDFMFSFYLPMLTIRFREEK